MNYQKTTMVPNSLFTLISDPQIKPSNIVLILIILRQTIGWYDPKTKKRKIRDWISYNQFQAKTGLSIKTISQSINTLIKLNLIKATDYSGNELRTSESRKGKVRIYYQCLLVDMRKSNTTYVKKYSEHRQISPITKLTPTKLTLQNKSLKKLTDAERLAEISNSKKYP